MSLFRSLKRSLRRALLPTRLMQDLETMRMAQGRILGQLNSAKPVQPLRDCEFTVFSQFGEDGIIQKLISELPIAHRTFIEFGVEDFVESNCRFLMMNNNWRGFVLDGSATAIASLKRSNWWWKYDVRAAHRFITRDTLNACLRASGFDQDLGLLSIDVDGVDYWLLEALRDYSPRILVVEYNALFGGERKITVPYHEAFSRRQQHYSDLYFGASLGALTHIANQKGYSLVGTTSTGVNAFFVRNDLMGGLASLSGVDGYTATCVRQSRNREGRLDYLNREEQYAAVRGLPVVNVETGETEAL